MDIEHIEGLSPPSKSSSSGQSTSICESLEKQLASRARPGLSTAGHASPQRIPVQQCLPTRRGRIWSPFKEHLQALSDAAAVGLSTEHGLWKGAMLCRLPVKYGTEPFQLQEQDKGAWCQSGVFFMTPVHRQPEWYKGNRLTTAPRKETWLTHDC